MFSRRSFLFGLGTVVVAPLIPGIEYVGAPVPDWRNGFTPIGRPVRRVVHDIMVGRVLDGGAPFHKITIGLYGNPNILLETMLPAFGSYRWVAPPGHEIVLIGGEALEVTVEPYSKVMRVQMVGRDTWDEDEHITWCESYTWPGPRVQRERLYFCDGFDPPARDDDDDDDDDEESRSYYSTYPQMAETPPWWKRLLKI